MACVSCNKENIDKKLQPGNCPICGSGLLGFQKTTDVELMGWCRSETCVNSQKNKPEGIVFWRL